MLGIYHEQLIFTMRTPREGSQGLTLLSARDEKFTVEGRDVHRGDLSNRYFHANAYFLFQRTCVCLRISSKTQTASMFPLFDLDDDAIVAALGFDDPRSLCSATMVCRRLRRLADAAWTELDRNLEANKREGGNTPRERVLSSFVVHSDVWRWISHVALRRFNRMGDMQHIDINPTELASRDHLLYLQMINTSNNTIYYDFFIGASDALNTSQNVDTVDLPMERERICRNNDFGNVRTRCYEHPFNPPHSVARLTSSLRNDTATALSPVDITIIVVDRLALTPRILFNKKPSPTRPTVSSSKPIGKSYRMGLWNLFLDRWQ